MKRFVKKYSYLVAKKCRDLYRKTLRRVKFFILSQDPFEVDPLDTQSLSLPAQWSKFGHDPIIVEIGTGHGELLRFLGKKNPDRSIIGFEITKTYTRKTDKKIRTLSNSKVFLGNGYECSTELFPNDSISKIYILFPDPWHKKRHHKRRPINPVWLVEIYKRMLPGGSIYFASDWDEYYGYVKEQFNEVNKGNRLYDLEFGVYEPKAQGLTNTHYYDKWKEMGRTFDYIRATVLK